MENIKKEIQSQVSLLAVLKRFLIIFLPVLMLASYIAILFYYTEAKNVKEERRIFEISEIDNVKLQMEMIINDFHMIISDLIIQSKHPEIQKILESDDTIHRKALAEEFLVFCDKRGIYDQIRLLDETGMEVVRINYNKRKPCIVPENQLQPKGKRYYFKDTLQLNKGEVFISPFDLNIEGGEIEKPLKPMIRFGTPVFDSHDQKRGVVILNFLGEKLINKLKTASVNAPGHVILLNSKGYWLRGRKPEEEWGFMYKDRSNIIFGNTFPNAWQRISSAESGHFYNKNGLFTFATVCPLTEAWIATTGSDKTFTNDDKKLKAQEHCWKIVSYVTPEVLNIRLRTFTNTLFSVYGVFIVLIGVGVWFLARSGAKRKIAEKTLRKHRKHLQELVEVRTAEITKTNEKLKNEIIERKKAEDELIKAQKLESMGTFAGGIAHDFSNSLQGILGNIALAKTYANPTDEIYEKLAKAEEITLHAKNLPKQLLTFSRGGAPVKKAVSVQELINNSINLVLIGSKVRCEVYIPDNLRAVEADRGQIIQAINNLLINADHAMPDGGVIKIKTENINIKAKNPLPLKEGEYVRITIEDQGTGIPKEHLQKIFDPYFTTKEKGSGLGLAIAYSIIRKHDGHITAESIMEVGTTFHVYLPASREKAMEKPVLSEAREQGVEKIFLTGKRKVLLMDDEDMIRFSTSEHLKHLGYEVETAEDGSEAIKLYKSAMKSGKPFDAIVMDLTIPGGMGGEKTIKKLLEIDPNVKGIVASGYFNNSIMANFREYGFKGVIAKPYEIHELNEILQKVINVYT